MNLKDEGSGIVSGAESQSEFISVLIPERGRPDELDNCITSLVTNAGEDVGYEINIAIDDDDEVWAARADPFIENRHIKTFRWPCAPTLGVKLNQLFKHSKGEIIWFIADDYQMLTEGWPAKFRAAVKALPNGIGVLYPKDDHHPGHTSLPILTRKAIEAVGMYMPPWFPFWFLDTWWDEIGIMTDLKVQIDCEVRHQGRRGGGHGYTDIQFWAEFFEEMRPLRSKAALDLVLVAYGAIQVRRLREWAIMLNERQELCARRVSHLQNAAFAKSWENRAISPPSAKYPEVKRQAQSMLEYIRKNRLR